MKRGGRLLDFSCWLDIFRIYKLHIFYFSDIKKKNLPIVNKGPSTSDESKKKREKNLSSVEAADRRRLSGDLKDVGTIIP